MVNRNFKIVSLAFGVCAVFLLDGPALEFGTLKPAIALREMLNDCPSLVSGLLLPH